MQQVLHVYLSRGRIRNFLSFSPFSSWLSLWRGRIGNFFELFIHFPAQITGNLSVFDCVWLYIKLLCQILLFSGKSLECGQTNFFYMPIRHRKKQQNHMILLLFVIISFDFLSFAQSPDPLEGFLSFFQYSPNHGVAFKHSRLPRTLKLQTSFQRLPNKLYFPYSSGCIIIFIACLDWNISNAACISRSA